MIPQRAIIGLIAGALGLPIVICVLLGLAHLLSAMQDRTGAIALDRICLAAAILWAINLIALLICLAINSIDRPDRP